MVKFFKHVFGCMNCWLDAARHLLTTTAWRFDFARTAGAFGDLHLVSIAQIKTVIDQCDITFCTAGVDRHSTFITPISGHHISPHEIDIKPKNDDRPAGICPDAPMIFGIIWCSTRTPLCSRSGLGKWAYSLCKLDINNFLTISMYWSKCMMLLTCLIIGAIDVPDRSIVMLIGIGLHE